jgi:hypothetical protein
VVTTHLDQEWLSFLLGSVPSFTLTVYAMQTYCSAAGNE